MNFENSKVYFFFEIPYFMECFSLFGASIIESVENVQ